MNTQVDIIKTIGKSLLFSCLISLASLGMSVSAHAGDGGLSALHFSTANDEVVIVFDRTILPPQGSVLTQRHALYLGPASEHTEVAGQGGSPVIQSQHSGSGATSLSLFADESDVVIIGADVGEETVMVHGTGSGAVVQVHGTGSGAMIQVHGTGSGVMGGSSGALWGVLELIVADDTTMLILHRLTDAGLDAFFVAEVSDDDQWIVEHSFE